MDDGLDVTEGDMLEFDIELCPDEGRNIGELHDDSNEESDGREEEEIQKPSKVVRKLKKVVKMLRGSTVQYSEMSVNITYFLN